MSHALVIAAGNADRGDDGAGPAVAELLRSPEVAAELLVPRVLPPDLHASWTSASRVVIVDAVRSGARPGTVHRLDARAAPLPAALQSLSTHGVGLARAVELARVLDALPAELTVFGIEAEACELGQPLSPAVARAVHEVADAVRRQLERA
ncbi:MAG: hydrogenase maturation protease [Planctomycetes bacterium]|nr:hydrogenase maturation protease [Planctomycetota bacterium]